MSSGSTPPRPCGRPRRVGTVERCAFQLNSAIAEDQMIIEALGRVSPGRRSGWVRRMVLLGIKYAAQKGDE